jgi:predicted MFS family arabinose efflux permease
MNGMISGLGLGLMYLPAIVCVTIYFEKYRSLATGIAVCGSGLGTFLMAPLTELLVSNYSWRGAFLLIGALMLNCIVFGILFRPLLPPPTPPSINQVCLTL